MCRLNQIRCDLQKKIIFLCTHFKFSHNAIGNFVFHQFSFCSKPNLKNDDYFIIQMRWTKRKRKACKYINIFINIQRKFLTTCAGACFAQRFANLIDRRRSAPVMHPYSSRKKATIRSKFDPIPIDMFLSARLLQLYVQLQDLWLTFSIYYEYIIDIYTMDMR